MYVWMPLTKHMALLCGTCACNATEALAQPHPPKLKLIRARGGSIRHRCGPTILPSFLVSSPRLLEAEAAGGEGRRMYGAGGLQPRLLLE